MKNKNIVLSIIIIILVIGVGIAISYSFIGKSSVIGNAGNMNGEIKNMENAYEVTFSEAQTVGLDITLDDLRSGNASNTYTSYVEKTFNGAINIRSDKTKLPYGISCTYDIFYTPEVVYVPSENSQIVGLMELAILGQTQNKRFDAVSLGNVKNKLKLYSSSIKSNADGSIVTDNWNFSLRFYNLLIEQSSALGQKPSGKISIELGSCG